MDLVGDPYPGNSFIPIGQSIGGICFSCLGAPADPRLCFGELVCFCFSVLFFVGFMLPCFFVFLSALCVFVVLRFFPCFFLLIFFVFHNSLLVCFSSISIFVFSFIICFPCFLCFFVFVCLSFCFFAPFSIVQLLCCFLLVCLSSINKPEYAQ